MFPGRYLKYDTQLLFHMDQIQIDDIKSPIIDIWLFIDYIYMKENHFLLELKKKIRDV